jgi:hypothetical protein
VSPTDHLLLALQAGTQRPCAGQHSPAIDWTWSGIKGSCNQAIRKGGFELWKTAVFQMRESGIGEVTNPKPLTFRRHKDTDGHRKISA